MHYSDLRESGQFFTVSGTGIVTDCSHHFLEQLGYPAGAVLGTGLDALLWNTGWDAFAELTGELLDNPGMPVALLLLQTAANKPFGIRFFPESRENSIRYAYLPADQPVPVVGNDAVLMSKVLSHDLKEPLRKMAQYTDRIRGSAELSADNRMLLQLTNDLCYQTMERLEAFREYLYFSAPAMADGSFLPMADLVAKVWERVSEEHGVDRSLLQYESSVLRVWGHPERFQRLFYHLLDNAVKFRSMERPLRIAVRITPAGGHVTITVDDNGRGFAAEFARDVFGLFRKLDKHASGTGAGLAICRKIAEGYGGTVSASVLSPAGTRIRIDLPVSCC